MKHLLNINILHFYYKIKNFFNLKNKTNNDTFRFITHKTVTFKIILEYFQIQVASYLMNMLFKKLLQLLITYYS